MFNVRALLIGASLTLAACTSPEDKLKEAEAARIEADKKVADVNADVNKKAAEIKQKAADDVAAVAKDGAKKVDAADDAANKKIAEATDAMAKARNDLLDVTTRKLDGLDKDVVELRAKLEKKTSKLEADKTIQDLKTRSESVRKTNASDLAAATAATFDSVKKAVEARVADLDKAIADVKKRV
jgi:dGTP triphosphohydrolase